MGDDRDAAQPGEDRPGRARPRLRDAAGLSRLVQRVLVDSTATALELTQRAAATGSELLSRADLGVGPVRLTPEAYDRLRRFAAAWVRAALEVPHADDIAASPEDPAQRQDPETSLAVLLGDDPARPPPTERLKERFATLLERSARPEAGDGPHPAFLAMVDQLCPDEARIIRLLAGDGPQPVMDVSAAPWIGKGETLMAERLSMIGARAGCIEPDATPAYLSNLERLGIVGLHDEELVDHDDYELIRVSTEVNDLVEHIEEERNQRARLHRRTARLTPLGEAFVAATLGAVDADANATAAGATGAHE